MRYIPLLILVLPLLLINACGGSSPAGQPGAGTQTSLETDLAALPIPDDLETAQWDAMKAEFLRVVQAAGTEHRTTQVPTSDLSTVVDLGIEANGDGSATLSWGYRNQGDYNQDKLVAASDLTEIGRYYEHGETDEDWPKARMADGIADGFITVSDITPLGTNYNCRVDGYIVLTSRTPADELSWTASQYVAFATSAIPEGEYERRFTCDVTGAIQGDYFCVAPYYDEEQKEPGNHSNQVMYDESAFPITVTVPEVMYGNVRAQWQATCSGGVAPYDVEWEFQDGAETWSMTTDYPSFGINPLMLNDSRVDTVEYTYSLTVTDANDLVGVASGDFDILPDPTPEITVQVPNEMRHGEDANWEATWTYGTPPYEVTWLFNGGAENYGPVTASSPLELVRTMINETPAVAQEYSYSIAVSCAEGATGMTTGDYSVAPVPNEAPEIVSVEFDPATQVLQVSATDPNDSDILTVSVTEPTGLSADLTSKVASTLGPLHASFLWTADNPQAGATGTSTVTVEDSGGLTDTTTIEISIPPLGALYAIPQSETVSVGEPVTILVTTDDPGRPFQYLNMVSLTVEPGAEFVAESLDPGSIGSASSIDGIWSHVEALTMFYVDNLVWSGDNGDGLERWEFTMLPMGGHDITGTGGDLFNFQFTFSTPGTYHLGFVESTGNVKRTYYSDEAENEQFWGDISNDHTGIANTIEVVE